MTTHDPGSDSFDPRDPRSSRQQEDAVLAAVLPWYRRWLLKLRRALTSVPFLLGLTAAAALVAVAAIYLTSTATSSATQARVAAAKAQADTASARADAATALSASNKAEADRVVASGIRFRAALCGSLERSGYPPVDIAPLTPYDKLQVQVLRDEAKAIGCTPTVGDDR